MGQEKSSVVVKKSTGSMSSIFMHADCVDMCLMALGILGSVGDGFSTPLVLYISSKLMNNIGDASASFTESFTHNINKVSLPTYLYLSHTQTQAPVHTHTITPAKANWVWFCGRQNSVALMYLACGSFVACFLGGFLCDNGYFFFFVTFLYIFPELIID
jgi:ATP-binding cassette subfamily B (MDR/TAP) protein 1